MAKSTILNFLSLVIVSLSAGAQMNYLFALVLSVAAGTLTNAMFVGTGLSITNLSTSLLFTSCSLGAMAVLFGGTRAFYSCLLAFVLAALPVSRIIHTAWKPLYDALSSRFELVNNPQYLVVALLVAICLAALISYQFRNRTFHTLAGLGLSLGALLSLATFHYIVIHNGYSQEIKDIISSKSAVLMTNLDDTKTVDATCTLLRIDCQTTTLSNILKYPNSYQYGVSRIASDTRDRESIRYAWQEMDFNGSGDPEISTAVFFSRMGERVLIANAREDAAKAKNRHMFMLSALIAVFNASWLMLYAYLSTFHRKASKY